MNNSGDHQLKGNVTAIAIAPSSANSKSGWRGKLALNYAVADGQTRLIHPETQAPLRIQRPFYPEGAEVCHSVMVHTAGGMVGGDLLDYQIRLQPQSHALITTAAAHKVYRSTGAIAQQTTQIQIEEQASLEWFPQETIVFNAAQFQQSLRVDLAENAIWCGWDITRFGRSARGEQFTDGNWRSHLEVWQAGQPLWIDRQRLEGSLARIQSPHGLNSQSVVGTFALVGHAVTPEQVAQARQIGLSLLGKSSDQQPDIGVTRLNHGLICRYRGTSSQAARRWFVAVWQQLRPDYLNRPSCMPRVW
ncbi:MAG: urease accessory protein UreD [Thainema sp.]